MVFHFYLSDSESIIIYHHVALASGQSSTTMQRIRLYLTSSIPNVLPDFGAADDWLALAHFPDWLDHVSVVDHSHPFGASWRISPGRPAAPWSFSCARTTSTASPVCLTAMACCDPTRRHGQPKLAPGTDQTRREDGANRARLMGSLETRFLRLFWKGLENSSQGIRDLFGVRRR